MTTPATGDDALQGLKFAATADSAKDAGFGLKYAASGLKDIPGQLPKVADNVGHTMEEVRVLGSNLSRGIATGLSKVPGVPINDVIAAGANIDKVVLGSAAALGAGDMAVRGAHYVSGGDIDSGLLSTTMAHVQGAAYGGFTNTESVLEKVLDGMGKEIG